MPPLRKKILGAMFDVRPVSETGRVDFDKISALPSTVELRKRGISSELWIDADGMHERGVVMTAVAPLTETAVDKEQNPAKELEYFLKTDLNPREEIIFLGGQVVSSRNLKPRRGLSIERVLSGPKPELMVLTTPDVVKTTSGVRKANPAGGEGFETILAEIRKPVSPDNNSGFFGELKEIGLASAAAPAAVLPASPELDFWTRDFRAAEADNIRRKKFEIKLSSRFVTGFLAAAAVILSGVYFGQYGFSVKNEIVQEGKAAVQSIEAAKENLKKFNFASASDNFTAAYEEFAKAGESLNFMGASISSFIAEFPGAGKFKSAKNIIEAGKLIASSGRLMSDAAAAVAKTGAILNPDGSPGAIGQILRTLNDSLPASLKNIKKARALMADIDLNSLPEDKKSSVQELQAKLPAFEEIIGNASDYSQFLENLAGTKGVRKYLLVFQNPSELRPTGGFIGTYAVLTFKDGRLQDFFADDSYNLDGQLKDLIVPPLQLQHITPNWGMRDANWFVDFPTSASKISWFFKKEAGYEVDGVIAVNPRILSEILEIVGPIEMSEYGLSLNGENLMTAIQEEVEYNGDRTQPKKIVIDLAPIFLEKMYSAAPDKWAEIFNILVASLERKDILMYFRDLKLQGFSSEKGFSGAVKQTDSDYLATILTSVKGSKTDAVIDTSIKDEAVLENGKIKHKLTIIRQHNGGGTKYGFYNRPNPSYVKVLAPEGAELLNISGNEYPDYQPLLNYGKSDFKTDSDLFRLESAAHYEADKSTAIFRESGKTGFGFWMLTEPGETKEIRLDYTAPVRLKNGKYEIFFQKQPGLKVKNFEFSFSPPDGVDVLDSSPALNKIGGSYIFNGALEKDFSIELLMK